MRLVTDEESERFWAEGTEFYNTVFANGLPFYDVKGIVKIAIAEYHANKEGLTMYECNRAIHKDEGAGI